MRTQVLVKDKLRVTAGMVINAFETLEVNYQASDKEAIIACPFHGDDGKPHCYVNIRERPGVFHCFHSECGARGDFIELLMKLTGWNAYKATAFSRNLRQSVELDEAVVKQAEQNKTEQEDDPLAKYAYRHEYLYERGLSEETLQRFQIGYDREKNAIVLPWFDRHGKLVAIKKRRVLDKFYDYEQGADLAHTLFGLNLAKVRSFLWINEAEIDAMSMDQAFRLGHFDKHFALALGGKEIRESQIESVLAMRPTAIVLMLDNDSYGREAQEIVRQKLFRRVRVYEAEYPEGGAKDANELKYDQIVKLTLAITNAGQERQNARIPTSSTIP